MRTSLDKTTFWLMNATADDWESLEQIMPQVERYAGVADTSQVARLIVELVSEGLFEGRRTEVLYRGVTPEMIIQDPIEYWFKMTPTGRALWSSEAHKYEDDVA